MTIRLCVSIGAMLLSLACSPGGPVLDTGPRPDVGGSISGTVTTDDGATALGARRVSAVNVETGARIDTSTSDTGGYTMRVPRGTYRLEVELRAGEKLATQPETTEINAGDLDAGRNFVLAVASPR
jgi:hypothetical protein